MPDDTSHWPLPKFYFSVEGFPGTPVFQEVSGLDVEAQIIEYRTSDSAVFSQMKMPGVRQVGNATLKKGVFVAGDDLWTWFTAIKMNTIERSTITINLLDESGSPAMTWTLHNAFPTKLTGTDLESDGNEVAVETIELAFERIEVEPGA
jgi:phage tail-like protein